MSTVRQVPGPEHSASASDTSAGLIVALPKVEVAVVTDVAVVVPIEVETAVVVPRDVAVVIPREVTTEVPMEVVVTVLLLGLSAKATPAMTARTIMMTTRTARIADTADFGLP